MAAPASGDAEDRIASLERQVGQILEELKRLGGQGVVRARAGTAAGGRNAATARALEPQDESVLEGGAAPYATTPRALEPRYAPETRSVPAPQVAASRPMRKARPALRGLDRLELTEEQRRAVEEVDRDYAKQLETIQRLRDETIRKLLGPEQVRQYDQLQQEKAAAAQVIESEPRALPAPAPR
ncbi:MAG: hypothetical protein HY721_04125 [Planctomycetes bacterium]|nr:hypothetical protein [Planctomycetota bacterium]